MYSGALVGWGGGKTAVLRDTIELEYGKYLTLE